MPRRLSLHLVLSGLIVLLVHISTISAHFFSAGLSVILFYFRRFHRDRLYRRRYRGSKAKGGRKGEEEEEDGEEGEACCQYENVKEDQEEAEEEEIANCLSREKA